MKLTKELFIHNRISFDEAETDILNGAYKIISKLRYENIHSSGTEDSYIDEQCKNILEGIENFLQDYKNEYPEKG